MYCQSSLLHIHLENEIVNKVEDKSSNGALHGLNGIIKSPN